jgi:lysophospholipase
MQEVRPEGRTGSCRRLAGTDKRWLCRLSLSSPPCFEERPFERGHPLQLHETPANPAPRQGVVMGVLTEDGVPLRVVRWRPTTRRVRGTVCLLQGRAEFIEKYFEVVRELRRRGFAVVAFDWRGQGLSGRQVGNPRKGHVRDFSHYFRDLEAVRAQVLEPLMPQPHFALAHSMGGAIALYAAAEGRLPFARLVTTGPMLALSLIRKPTSAKVAALVLNVLGFGRSFVPGGGETSIAEKPFPGNPLTSDPVRYARNGEAAAAVGDGAIGDPTVAWVAAGFRVMNKLTHAATPLSIRLPTLVVAAGADAVCATPVIERFAARLKGGHAIVIPGARHEILMERDPIRDDFWAAFDAFVPGTPDPSFGPSAAQEGEDGLMEPAVADGDN